MSHKKIKTMMSTNHLEHIKNHLLPNLLKNKSSLHFRKPVDANKLNVPASFFFCIVFYFFYKVIENTKNKIELFVKKK